MRTISEPRDIAPRRFHFQAVMFLLAAFLLCPMVFVTQTAATNLHHDFLARLSAAAIERTHHTVRYDPGYVAITYPGGDVPSDSGVCSDEVIRAYRALGVDLQKEVHEDMKAHFREYPRISPKLDHNIDHRRVVNLMVFFSRK